MKAPYWIVTGLLAAFMLLGSIPDLLRVPQAVAIFMHLGQPDVSASVPRRMGPEEHREATNSSR